MPVSVFAGNMAFVYFINKQKYNISMTPCIKYLTDKILRIVLNIMCLCG